jgi:1,2-phenylacetyl-CoA epoxidase PaaB subunit
MEITNPVFYIRPVKWRKWAVYVSRRPGQKHRFYVSTHATKEEATAEMKRCKEGGW